MEPDNPLFLSVEGALIFAFNYSMTQSPRTPLASAIGHGSGGSNAGLFGIDGAAQAGLILSAVSRLVPNQRSFIVVKYGRHMVECHNCGQSSPGAEWREAAMELTNIQELKGIPVQAKLMIVERTICNLRIDVKLSMKKFGVPERTFFRKIANAREAFERMESQAINDLSGMISDCIKK